MAITPLPTPPSRQDPVNFNDRADAFLGALPTFAIESNAAAENVVAKEASAVAAASAAVAVSNTTKWISGTTYAEGAAVWSPINGFTYRRITAAGSGTTDPSLDTSNYAQISGSGNVSASASTLNYDGVFIARSGLPGTNNINKTGFAFNGYAGTGLFHSIQNTTSRVGIFFNGAEAVSFGGNNVSASISLRTLDKNVAWYNVSVINRVYLYDENSTSMMLSVGYDGTLAFNSGYGSASTAYGVRAWVNFNGSGTVAIRNSGNVSSVTDNGVGNYTINFATALVDTNYSAPASCLQASGRAITVVHPTSFNTNNLQIIVSDQIQAYDSSAISVAIVR